MSLTPTSVHRPARWLPVALVLQVLVLLVAITPAAAQQDEVTLTIGLHAAEKNLNPFITPQALPITHDFTMLVYDTLFWSQASPDPEPWLATSAEPSEDFRSWTVNLRDDVTWHDGEPFTAEDVAFTFQYFADDAGPGRYGHHVYDHPVFESATVLDDTTVELNFVEPITTFTSLPGGDLPILPEHIWAGIEDPRADATSLPIGTGPYVMTDYQPDTSYRLEANDDYFLGRPTVDVLEMPVVRDAQAAFAGLQSGELDFVTRNVPPPLIQQIQDNPDLDLITGSRQQSTYLMFNTRLPILDDPVVRHAMSMALDLDVMVEVIEGGMARPGNDTWTHPESPWAHPVGGHTFDVEAADAALEAAGYTRGEEGGIRVSADGQPLAFELLVNATAPPQIRTGELVAEQLAAVGVEITVTPLDPPAIGAARQPGGPGSPPSVEMFIAVFEAHAHSDPDHLFFFFHSPGRGVGAVFSGFSNEAFDAVVEQALGVSPGEKLGLVNQAQDIFAEQSPAVTLYYPDGRWAYNSTAYDGWIDDPGHGAFTKRSFLADYARVSAAPVATPSGADATEAPSPAAETDPPSEADTPAEATEESTADPAPAEETADDGGGGTAAIVIVLLGVLALGAGAVLVTRRRSGTVDD